MIETLFSHRGDALLLAGVCFKETQTPLMGPAVGDRWVVSRASTHSAAVHGLFMKWGGGWDGRVGCSVNYLDAT